MNEFISTTEAAKILGVSRVTLFNKIKSGEIEAIKVGRNYIIQRDIIEKLSEGRDLSYKKKAKIDEGINRVVNEYGETLKLLKDN